jgi:hypothetical protein
VRPSTESVVSISGSGRRSGSRWWAFAWARAAGQIELRDALSRAPQEAVSIYRRLAPQVPGTFDDDLLGALAMLADVLDGLKRHDAATELRKSLADR